MKTAVSALSIFVLLAVASATSYSETLHARSGVSPVQKVIQMLSDMLSKSKAEKQDEEVRFAAFKQFCAGSAAEKTASIEEANTAIGKISGEIEDLTLELDQLGADIKKAESDAKLLSSKIGELATEIADFDKEMGTEEKEREEEHADFEKKDGDYATSIDSLDRAITEVQNSEPGAAASMLQVASLKMVSGEAKRKIFSFLQRQDNDNNDDPSALLQREAQPTGEAAAYEGQTAGIVDMFKKLDDKFESEREAGQKSEMETKGAYDLLMQQMSNLLDKAKDDKEQKTAQKSKREQDRASAEGELAETKTQKAEDIKYLKELNEECEKKSADFEARQEMRAGEIGAITKAVEILSGGAVAGASSKHLELAQDDAGAALVQLRSGYKSPLQNKVAVFLQNQASAHNSRILSMLATRVNDDPFTKVKKMIKDMITRLMEEANEEAEHKGWCDTELGTNQQTRDTKTEDAETLKATIEELTATSAKLAEDLTELSEGVATIDAAVADQTASREEEKAKNEEAIADAKAAQTAVTQAIEVLKDFYAKAADATAFAQTGQGGPADDAPETFSTAFKGGDSSGVMGMLEVVQSDFARLETETTAAEAEASRAYDEFMGDSAEQKAVKSTGIKHKTNKKQETESALSEAKRDLEGTQEELDAALAYYEKLKPSCVDSGSSYEERVARRKEEIESLQEALKILSGDDIAV